MPVWTPTSARRVCSSITISSSDALTARSPMPLIAHSTWRAPAWIPAYVLAAGSPGGGLGAGEPGGGGAGGGQDEVGGPGHELVEPRQERDVLVRHRVADG